MNNYTYTEWNDGGITIYQNGEPLNAITAFWICTLLNNLKKEDDSKMLFHECPNCNGRCNCSQQPCSCCRNPFGKDTKPNQSA